MLNHVTKYSAKMLAVETVKLNKVKHIWPYVLLKFIDNMSFHKAHLIVCPKNVFLQNKYR